MPTPQPRKSSSVPNVASFESLAARFRRHHRSAIDSWIAAAEVLAEARDTLGHGQWGPFLKACGISPRSASRMVRVARTGIKSATMADLGGVVATVEALPDLETLAELEDKLHFAEVELAQTKATIDELRERLALMEEQASPEVRAQLQTFTELQEDNRASKARINELLARINEAEGENKGLRKRLREAGVDIKL